MRESSVDLPRLLMAASDCVSHAPTLCEPDFDGWPGPVVNTGQYQQEWLALMPQDVLCQLGVQATFVAITALKKG